MKNEVSALGRRSLRQTAPVEGRGCLRLVLSAVDEDGQIFPENKQKTQGVPDEMKSSRYVLLRHWTPVREWTSAFFALFMVR